MAELESLLVCVYGEKYRELASKFIINMFFDAYHPSCFVVAKSPDNRIIGTACYQQEIFTLGVWGISWVSVDPAWRSKGLGSRLVDECLGRIKAQVPDRKVTVILASDPDKTAFYERLGFVKGGTSHEGGSFMLKHL